MWVCSAATQPPPPQPCTVALMGTHLGIPVYARLDAQTSTADVVATGHGLWWYTDTGVCYCGDFGSVGCLMFLPLGWVRCCPPQLGRTLTV